MPALGEIGRRRFLYALSGFGVNVLFGACNTSSPEPIFKPTYVPSTTTDEFPKPPEKPNPTPEPIKAAPALPTSSRTPRAGPLPTVDIPELRRTPVAESTPKPTPKPTEIPTPTPQPENEDPLSFSVLWEKEVPIASNIPEDTIFTDENRSYLIKNKTFSSYNHEDGKGWSWTLQSSGNREHQPTNYDSDFLFLQYTNNLQINNNRLTVETFIEAWDKKSGIHRGYGWSQPQNGSHQFIYHDGVIERLLVPGGSVETSFEVYSKSFQRLWQAPGRLYHTSSRHQLAVIRLAGFDNASQWLVADLQTGQNRKPIFLRELGDTTIGETYFEEEFMWAIVQNNGFYLVNLRSPQAKKLLDNNKMGGINGIAKTNKETLFIKHNFERGRPLLSAVDKLDGKVLWTEDFEDLSVIGEVQGMLLAQNDKARKIVGFNTKTGSRWEIENQTANGIVGNYKDTIVVRRGAKDSPRGLLGIGERNRKVRFSYSGWFRPPAISGRVLVFGILDSNKLSVVDIETGKETVHTMKGEVVGIISPKSRFFLVQTSRPKGFLTAIKI